MSHRRDDKYVLIILLPLSVDNYFSCSLNSLEYIVISDAYNGQNAQEEFENELEKALEAGYPTIVIEHVKWGEDTARWIRVGYCLNNTSIITGLGSIFSTYFWPSKPYIYCPLTAISVFCSCFYHLSWEKDPCSKYKVERNPKKSLFPKIGAPSPIVLVKRENKKYNITQKINVLKTAISIIAFAFSAWRLYLMKPQYN